MIPTSVIDEADAIDQPRLVYEKIPVKKIIDQMSSVF
jgi:hypothetical protein